MDKPDKQPTRDMLSAYSVGVILSMTFNKDATDESRAQAEHDSGYCGSFDYEMIFDLVGSSGTCSIGEYTVELLEFNVGSGGGWILDRNTRVLCENWEKWIKSEERDLKTYRRLQKKFAYVDTNDYGDDS